MTSPLRTASDLAFETPDPRSDDRRRFVRVAREAVTIRRTVAGVAMTIRIAPAAYRGVALRIRALEGGRFQYEVKLVHRDPDLSVALGAGDDLAAMEARWREWAACLRLPALAGRAEAVDAPVNLSRAALASPALCARRRAGVPASRRPRFLKRRAQGLPPQEAGAVDCEPVVLFFGWKGDR